MSQIQPQCIHTSSMFGPIGVENLTFTLIVHGTWYMVLDAPSDEGKQTDGGKQTSSDVTKNTMVHFFFFFFFLRLAPEADV